MASAAIRVTVGQIDRRAFFTAVRQSGVAGRLLKQKSVDSLNAILDEWQRQFPRGLDLRWIAYTMATARHEAWNPRNQQIEYDIGEIGGASRSYGRTGFFGRGLTQLTHEDNYRRAGARFGVDLVAQPWLACRKDISAGILVLGSFEGWFRGDRAGRHKLSRFFDENTDDPVGARNIINGDVGKNGALVARHHAAFLRALAASLTASEQPRPSPPPAPTPAPMEPPMPVPGPIPDAKRPLASRTVIANIVGALAVLGTTWGLNLTPEHQAIIVTVISGLWFVASTYFRVNANAPIQGSPLARSIEGLKDAEGVWRAEQAAQPVHEAWNRAPEPDLSSLDLGDLVRRMPFEQLAQQAAAAMPVLAAVVQVTQALHANQQPERLEPPHA